jgi:plasmid stability protein
MAAVSIRDLDDSVREKLRMRAARHGRSMEAEMRAILTAAVTDEQPRPGLFTTLTSRFSQLGGVDLDPPARTNRPRAAGIDE